MGQYEDITRDLPMEVFHGVKPETTTDALSEAFDALPAFFSP